MAGDVPVYSPITGLVEQVDETEARRRVREEGSSVATPEQVERDRLEREYGGTGDMVAAGLAGAASGLTFGASDVIASELGGAERLRAYRELHPIATGVGEFAGIGAAALAGGGGALGRAISAPLRGLEAAGAAAGRAVGGGVRGAIAREAVLGAGFGGGMELGAQARAQAGYDGERLVSAMGMGAVMGGALGGLIGSKGAVSAGAQRLRNAMTAPAEEAAAQAAARMGASEGAGTLLGRAARKAHELTGGEGGAVVEKLASDAAAREQLRHAERFAEEATKRAIREAQQSEAALRQMKQSWGAGKPVHWEKVVQASDDRLTRDAASGHAAEIAGDLVQMQAAGGGAFGFQAKIKNALAMSREALNKAQVAKTAAEVAHIADGLKRDLQGIAQWTGQRAKTTAENATANALDEMSERVRKHLMDPSLYGEKAATMQREVNAGFAELFDAQRATGGATRAVLDPSLGRFNRFEGMTVSEGRAAEVLGNPLSPRNAEALGAWKDRLQRGNKIVTAALDHMELSGAERKVLERYRASAEAAIDSMGQVESTKKLLFDVSKMNRGPMPGGSVMAAIGGAAAAAAGIPLGVLAPVAAVLGTAANPERFFRGVAAVEDMGRRVLQRARRGPAAMARASKLAAKESGTPTVARAPIWTAHEAAARARAERQHAAALAAKPERVREAAVRQLAMVAPAMPHAVQAAADVAARGAAYLALHAPKPQVLPGALPGQIVPPSDYAIEVWERRRQVVEKPERVVEMIGKGEFTTEALDAIRTVYPLRYQEIRDAYLAELTEMGAKGLEPPREQVPGLELLLGMALEPIDAPDAAASAQAVYAAAQAAEAQQRSAPRRSGESRIASKMAREEQMEPGDF